MKTIYVGEASDIKIVLREKRFRDFGDIIIGDLPHGMPK
jgi:hypothetical protein